MPTYSYRCANCDFAFEQYQSFTDDSLTVCPHCGQSQLRKVFSDIGVTFKGSGFYHNDSRAKPVGSKPSHHKSGAEKSGPDKAAASTGSGEASAKPKSDKTPAAKPAASAASGSSGNSGNSGKSSKSRSTSS